MIQPVKSKILELFFEEPARNFQIREISRITGIAAMSARKYLEKLKTEGLIEKSNGAIYSSYRAGNSRMFRLYKQQAIMLKIYQSGLVDYLERETLPRSIVLFGSARKGEHDKSSDIDLFVQSAEKKLALEKFEKALKHKISILFEPKLKNLSKELFNNITNGILLYGYLKVR
ncbi:MAG: nucleotidyltransferase domain-containing protein [Nanoarchaeota archaeon]|nr:nucleotidyltransferase domain-containing protein [Nanoarchaeota archaeon]